MIGCRFAIPGELASPTGGYAYDRAVLARLPALGIDARHVALSGTFPDPDGAALEDARRQLAGPEPILVDGLAFGAFDAATLGVLAAPIAALVHHPLALETGTAPERAAALRRSETQALARADAVIATSEATADILRQDYGVPPARLTVAEPGVAPAERARGSGDGVPTLLAVGSVTRRKGYDVLVAALATVKDLPWRLTIAGDPTRAPEAVRRLRDQIAAAGLAERVTLAGAVGDAALAALYAGADLFVMPSRFEGYGMAVTEALARGLPLVSTDGGALAATVPDDAALKVAAGDAAAFGAALRRVLLEPGMRRRLADAAWARAGSLPRWDDAAARIAAVLQGIAR